MKKALVTLIATILTVAALHAFRLMQNSSISGKILPPEGADLIWAIGGTDSIKTNAVNGAFAITVKSGTWKIIIDAKEPFKDVVLDKIEAKEGQNTDLGEIRLQQ